MCERVDTTIVHCQSERDIMYNMGCIWCPVSYSIAGQCLERESPIQMFWWRHVQNVQDQY